MKSNIGRPKRWILSLPARGINIRAFCPMVILLSLAVWQLPAQEGDYEWWNQMHNWDGVTHWSDYIIPSPYYMGPNALPVPYSEKGKVRSDASFGLGYRYHFSASDPTQNLYAGLYVPLFGQRAALGIWGAPVERYNMDASAVMERRTRNRDGKGNASGDIHIDCIYQILRNKSFPDLALRISLRTASGNSLGDARYTDAPGYSFDLSAGKEIPMDSKGDKKICIHAMAGFYAWQMNLKNNRQNDAFLFGTGADFHWGKFSLENSLAGYLGYLGDEEATVVKQEPVAFRDRPVVFRTQISHRMKKINAMIGYQAGLHDWQYHTLKITLEYRFSFR